MMELDFVHFEVVKIVLWPVKVRVVFCPNLKLCLVLYWSNHLYNKNIVLKIDYRAYQE